MPSYAAARSTGRTFTPLQPNQMGILGLWTGPGSIRTPSTLTRPVLLTTSPAHRAVSAATPRSRISARSLASLGSPKAENSRPPSPPRPSPSVRRPALRRSRVTVSLASLIMRRRAMGVTIVPSRIRFVDAAIAASTTQGSEISQDSGSGLRTWSQTNSPSQPFSSAARLISTTVAGSAKGPNRGRLMACRTDEDYRDPAPYRRKGEPPCGTPGAPLSPQRRARHGTPIPAPIAESVAIRRRPAGRTRASFCSTQHSRPEAFVP